MEERLLLFSAGGEKFAFPLHEVCEVMELQASYPFPRAPRHFVGLINFHGNLTALVDLERFIGREGGGKHGKVLVLDTKIAHLALLVDGVRSILPAGAILGASPVEGDPIVAGMIETEQGSFRLLAVDRLVDSLEQGLKKNS
ncbi:hypothetical protein GMSM_01180 [Geomonas sp. Red276]